MFQVSRRFACGRSVMSIRGTSVCFLLALCLTNHFAVSDGTSPNNGEVPADDNGTRPETITPQGTVRGVRMTTHHNRSVSGFIGIPYAQPPVGDLRFRAPLPPNSWNGTLDASRETSPCPQFDDDGLYAGDEDCLYLNVFTPQLPTNGNLSLLPVMVYVIGGGFRTENNSLVRFGPDFLLDKDVLLIVPNFRVGVLGYLSTGDEIATGNYGLKDMVRALEWTQENIRYFGGDPDQVTLFGGSSGAMSVHLLALSNLTDGLFHRYITQSGVAIGGAFESNIQSYANRAVQLGEFLDCPIDTSTLLVNCLRNLNASQLQESVSLFYEWRTYPSSVWTPVIEPDLEGAFLTDDPVDLYAAGKIRDLPWISSVTRDEGLMITLPFYEDRDMFEDFLENIDLALPLVAGYRGRVENETSHTAALRSYYLNDLSANRSLLLNNLTLLLGDAMFIYPAYNAFQQQLLYAQNPQYFCSFEYRGVFSYTYLFSGGSTAYTGVAHGDETIYLFKTHDLRFGPSGYEFSEDDLRMVDAMVALWTSFAINGTPTTTESGTVWESFTSNGNYLRIGNQSDTSIEMRYNYLEERMNFWNELNTRSSAEFRNPLRALLVVLNVWLILF